MIRFQTLGSLFFSFRFQLSLNSVISVSLQHEALRAELREKQADMDQLISTAEDLQRELENVPHSDPRVIQREMETLRDEWLQVSAASHTHPKNHEAVCGLNRWSLEPVAGISPMNAQRRWGLNMMSANHGRGSFKVAVNDDKHTFS